MSKMKHIFKKEFGNYFVSPVAYIVIAIFLGLAGFLFFSSFFISRQASMYGFFKNLPMFFSFMIPAITMRLFSEEINLGSYELLITLPVTFRDIIMGKFLAAVAFVGVMLAPTILYPVIVSTLGDLDWGPVIGGYLGAFLLGACFCAIGVFASTLTKNQVIAFIVSAVICVLLTMLLNFIVFFVPDFMTGFVQFLNADAHFANIAKGIVDTRDIIYFCSVCFVALYGADTVMRNRG